MVKQTHKTFRGEANSRPHCVSGVTMAGRVRCARSVCPIRAAFTGPATSRGSASVRRTGEDCSATKVGCFKLLQLILTARQRLAIRQKDVSFIRPTADKFQYHSSTVETEHQEPLDPKQGFQKCTTA